MPPKPSQLAKMIADTEEKVLALQEQLAAGGMDPTAEAAAWQSIDDQLSKIKRLQDVMARLAELKKAK